MDNEYKNLKVKADTHNRVKVLAAMAGKTIDEFVGVLTDTYERYQALKNPPLGKRPEREQDHEGDPGGHG